MGGEDTAATAGSISAGVLKSQSGDRSHVTVLFGDQEYVRVEAALGLLGIEPANCSFAEHLLYFLLYQFHLCG